VLLNNHNMMRGLRPEPLRSHSRSAWGRAQARGVPNLERMRPRKVPEMEPRGGSVAGQVSVSNHLRSAAHLVQTLHS
jgi:hypothetical protein